MPANAEVIVKVTTVTVTHRQLNPPGDGPARPSRVVTLV